MKGHSTIFRHVDLTWHQVVMSQGGEVIDEPLRAHEAGRLIRQLLRQGGTVRFTSHALRELEKDDLEEIDAINVLRVGVVAEAEWENGGWRHRVQTPRVALVVEFEQDENVVVVVITGWRKQ